MGECPRWYRVQNAARYLGCPPWELEERGWRYVRMAEEAAMAEAHAEEQSAKMHTFRN